MLRRSEEELVPRNGHTLVVAIVCRISGCAKQKEVSLDDQEDNVKEHVHELWDGPIEFRVISTRGKGERLDRPEIEQVEAIYRSGKYDIVGYDDLSRLIRGGEAARLLGIGVDNGTRSLCIQDGIDTNDDTWEEDALNACSENVAHNARTSKRVKQKLKNRFKKGRGATARPIAGYIVPPGARTYEDWTKADSATPIIQEGKRRLRETLNCAAVAEWFNDEAFAPGPYCRKAKWDGPMVRQFFKNPLLKGQPGRGFRHTIKRYEPGHRISVKNPKGPVFLNYPHLAHIDPCEFDELNALLQSKNKNRGRKPKNGQDPLLGVQRKRTRYPGQHARCWYCGRHCVWGGNGITEHLMCSGARSRECWNSMGFDGPLAARRLVEIITAELYQLDSIDEQFSDMVARANDALNKDVSADWAKLRQDELQHARAMANVQKAILEYGTHPLIKSQLADIEASERTLILRRRELESVNSRTLELPGSVAGLRSLLEEQFLRLAVASFEFGDLMRQLIPNFHYYLVRLCDGGHLLPRATVTLDLVGDVTDAQYVPRLKHLLRRQITLDLFTIPKREQIRLTAVGLHDQGLHQREIARRLPGKISQAEVSKALLLEEKRIALGLDEPYITILEPPDDYSKLRRHRHRNYRFEPLDGYTRPQL